MATLLVLTGDLVRAEEYARRAVALLRGDAASRRWNASRGDQASGRPYLETEVLCEMADLIEARSLSNMPDGVRQRIREWEGHLTFLSVTTSRGSASRKRRSMPSKGEGPRSLLLAQAEGQRRQGKERRSAPNLHRLRATYEAALKGLSGLDARAGRAERDAAEAHLFSLRVRIDLLTTETIAHRRPRAPHDLGDPERLDEEPRPRLHAGPGLRRPQRPACSPPRSRSAMGSWNRKSAGFSGS
jgi:hypothetical protein